MCLNVKYRPNVNNIREFMQLDLVSFDLPTFVSICISNHFNDYILFLRAIRIQEQSKNKICMEFVPKSRTSCNNKAWVKKSVFYHFDNIILRKHWFGIKIILDSTKIGSLSK